MNTPLPFTPPPQAPPRRPALPLRRSLLQIATTTTSDVLMSAEETPKTMLPSQTSSEGGVDSGAKKAKLVAPHRLSPAPRRTRTIGLGFLAFFFLLGFIALVLYLVYRPSSPRFTVVGAAVYDLRTNTSAAAATTISSSMQFTVRVRNPNERSSVQYDRLSALVMYRDQAITPATPLPALYQEEDSTVAMSPVLGAGPVPVSPEVAGGLAADQAYGVARLRLVLSGRLKYKAGPFRSAWYGLYVRCDVLAGVKKEMYGQVPILGTPACAVET